jgi:hypothetical protein
MILPTKRIASGLAAAVMCLAVPTLSSAQPLDPYYESYEPPDAPLMHLPPDPHEEENLPEWRHDPDEIEAIAFSVWGSGLSTSFDEIGIGGMPGVDVADVIADRELRLDGAGWGAGGGVRALIQGDYGIRGRIGIGAYHLGDVGLIHDELPAGVSVALARLSMLDFELALGKAFDARYLYPYIEVVNRFNVLSAVVDINIEGYGSTGSNELAAFSYTLAPRIGAFIPLDDDVFIDVSGQYGLFGVERAAGFVSLGLWSEHL